MNRVPIPKASVTEQKVVSTGKENAESQKIANGSIIGTLLDDDVRIYGESFEEDITINNEPFEDDGIIEILEIRSGFFCDDVSLKVVMYPKSPKCNIYGITEAGTI